MRLAENLALHVAVNEFVDCFNSITSLISVSFTI